MFKNDFIWGSASAAYQVEGAIECDGKGKSIWDTWAHIEGKTFEGTNGDRACDHYHRFKEDVALMKEQGLKSYRFSIAWTRLFPKGRGQVNEKGLEFYHNLIDALVDSGIEPMVTLYHWDLPQALQDEYSGWLSRHIVDDFLHYAKTCFEQFGHKVKYWIVLNEPNIFTELGYLTKLHPPGLDDTYMYLKAYHHTALVHSKTVLLYKSMKLPGMIGSSIAFSPGLKASDDDEEALKIYEATHPHWYMDPYMLGSYPELGIKYYSDRKTLPEFSREDMDLLKEGSQATDFIGINYYQTTMVQDHKNNGFEAIKNPQVKHTDWGWAIDPDGLYIGLKQLKVRYDKPIIISENGLGAYDYVNEKGQIEDQVRIDFLKDHIVACKKALSEGVDLRAYMTWSFTDLLSWLNGYKKRYGFVYIDFESEDLRRIKKQSFYWYQRVIKRNGNHLE